MTTTEKSLALCHAIEDAGASEPLTKCSVLASELHSELVAERSRLESLAARMKQFVAANYPAEANGQVHFSRALVESYADEILNK